MLIQHWFLSLPAPWWPKTCPSTTKDFWLQFLQYNNHQNPLLDNQNDRSCTFSARVAMAKSQTMIVMDKFSSSSEVWWNEILKTWRAKRGPNPKEQYISNNSLKRDKERMRERAQRQEKGEERMPFVVIARASFSARIAAPSPATQFS